MTDPNTDPALAYVRELNAAPVELEHVKQLLNVANLRIMRLVNECKEKDAALELANLRIDRAVAEIMRLENELCAALNPQPTPRTCASGDCAEVQVTG